MSDVVAVDPVLRRHARTRSSAAPTSAPGSGISSRAARSGASAPRRVVDHSIGPVWEANHVWLIFVLVVLWTGFSEAFASIMLTLFVPLSLAALGIVLRGSSFAFRKEVYRTSSRRNFGAAFAISSVIVPFCMGAVAGAIASGRVPAGGVAGDTWDSWINPTSILGGVLAVSVCAYLAAVYMVWDARRFGDDEMAEYFRRRAIGAAVVTGARRARRDLRAARRRPYVFDGLTSRALAARDHLGASVASARSCCCVRQNHRGARILAIGAVVAVIWGGAWPSGPTSSRRHSRCRRPRRPTPRSWTVLIVFVVAAIVILPSLGLLYDLDQRGLVEIEEATP